MQYMVNSSQSPRVSCVDNNLSFKPTVDGSEIRLTCSYGGYTIICRGSYISGGAGLQPPTVPFKL